ncbi:MAG: MEDS domain-containing protein [Proteobacteria bacterium]|nr:MEDS domain-containing protein [Pseudomonadota bacterium]
MVYIRTSDQDRLDLGFQGHQCNWGAHFCGLYETETERDEIVMGFLAQGVMDGDLELYCPAERTPEDFKEKFGPVCPACENALNDPAIIQLLSTRDLYYSEGVFSPWTMDDSLNAFFIESQESGPRNVRATAEMVWALEAVPGVEHLMAYESRLNYFIAGKPWISVCLYNLTKFDGKTIMDVLRTHPYTISKGVITENPFFQDPDEWLAANAPQFLTRN